MEKARETERRREPQTAIDLGPQSREHAARRGGEWQADRQTVARRERGMRSATDRISRVEQKPTEEAADTDEARSRSGVVIKMQRLATD